MFLRIVSHVCKERLVNLVKMFTYQCTNFVSDGMETRREGMVGVIKAL